MRYVIMFVIAALAFIALLPLITQMGRKIKNYFVKEMDVEHIAGKETIEEPTEEVKEEVKDEISDDK